jgi:hypothetical protein
MHRPVGSSGARFPSRNDRDGTLTNQRLHQLIRQPGSIRERLVEIELLGAGAQADRRGRRG